MLLFFVLLCYSVTPLRPFETCQIVTVRVRVGPQHELHAGVEPGD